MKTPHLNYFREDTINHAGAIDSRVDDTDKSQPLDQHSCNCNNVILLSSVRQLKLFLFKGLRRQTRKEARTLHLPMNSMNLHQWFQITVPIRIYA